MAGFGPGLDHGVEQWLGVSMPSWRTNAARVAQWRRNGLKIHGPKGLAGSNPAPGTQNFAPTNESRSATLSRRAIEIWVEPSHRQLTPTLPQASMKIPRMCPDSF